MIAIHHSIQKIKDLEIHHGIWKFAFLIMKAFAFECTHILLGMVSCLNLMIEFVAFVQLLDDHPTSDDIVCKMVMRAIDEFDLPASIVRKAVMLIHQS